MHAHEIWWSLAVMVATTEIFFGALYFASAGFALFCGGVAARFGANLVVQVAVAVVVFALALIYLRWRKHRRMVSRRQG